VRAALAVLHSGIALCLEIGDHGTRGCLERIVIDEEHHIDWIETQRHKIAEVGYQQCLGRQIYA
jgi:bacterioferritin